MRQFGCVRGRRLYFSLTHRSACPTVRPSIQIGGASWQGSSLSFPSLLFTEAARRRGRRTSRWSERLTWHAVSVDKNVTRTKLTSLSRSFQALDVGGGLAEIARSSYSPGARGEKRGNRADWIRMFSATNYSRRSHGSSPFSVFFWNKSRTWNICLETTQLSRYFRSTIDWKI